MHAVENYRVCYRFRNKYGDLERQIPQHSPTALKKREYVYRDVQRGLRQNIDDQYGKDLFFRANTQQKGDAQFDRDGCDDAYKKRNDLPSTVITLLRGYACRLHAVYVDAVQIHIEITVESIGLVDFAYRKTLRVGEV